MDEHMDNHPPVDAPADFFESLPEPPKWPKVVGIISIVWAALGLGCGGCGMLGPVFQKTFTAQAEKQFGEPMPQVMLPTAMQTVAQGVGLAWTLVLLVAGILCVTRRPVSRPLHVVYAVGSIVMTFWGISLALAQQAALGEWVRQNPTSKWAQMHNPTMGLAIMGVVVLLGLSWPAFCLVWFGFVKRRREDLTGGLQEPAA